MLDGWIWADEETVSSPMEFAWGDEEGEPSWDESLDLGEEEEEEGDEGAEVDDLDDERDDEDEEDDGEWEEWENEFEEEDDDGFGRRRTGRPEWN